MDGNRVDDRLEWTEDELIERALQLRIEEEIMADEAALDDETRAQLQREIQEMRPQIDRRIDQLLRRRKVDWAWQRIRGGLRAASVAAAVLAVAFSGVCLASPAIREQLVSLIETGWRNQMTVSVNPTASEAADLPTVPADDPRLAYVFADWCLHYYPLEIPREYAYASTIYMESDINGDEFGFWYLTAEGREAWLERDYQVVTFRDPNDMTGDFITFEEDGRPGASYTYNTKYNGVAHRTIAGRDVIVVETGSTTKYIWQQDDHLLRINTSLSEAEIAPVIASVERIR